MIRCIVPCFDFKNLKSQVQVGVDYFRKEPSVLVLTNFNLTLLPPFRRILNET